MALYGSIEDHFSDEEIYMGQLTIKEIKKRVLPDNYCRSRQTFGYLQTDKEETDTSLKLIETHSAPNILPKDSALPPTIEKSESSPGLYPEIASDWDIKPDDSFLKLEQLVSEITMSSKDEPIELPSKQDTEKNSSKDILSSNDINESHVKGDNDVIDLEVSEICNDKDDCNDENTSATNFKTPLKNNHIIVNTTPETAQIDIFSTPSSEVRNKTPVFKTPGNPVSHRKPSVTPSKRFQHVQSPVATYIKKCPTTPLVKDVFPKKPLPGVSSIPKPIKSVTQTNVNNKENNKQFKQTPKQDVKLPSVAYRTAKETKVVSIPDENKMPHNQWARQVASSIPKALVLKHNHRQISSAKKPLQIKQEDSFADLSLHQADLSLCTQKSAFTKN